MPMLSREAACSGRPATARPAASVLANVLLVIGVCIWPSRKFCVSLIFRQRARRYICILQPHGPLDGPGHHLLEFRLIPVRFHMAQRRVVDATLAVHFGPGYCEVAVGAVD